MHWSPQGHLLGVIDWDLAQPFDPAVDVACLAQWHGWNTVRRATEQETMERARIWHGTFAIEQIAKHLLDGAAEAEITACVERVARWMQRDNGAEST